MAKKKSAKKSITTSVSIWPKKDGSICMRIAGKVMSTVNKKVGSKRCHQHLYKQLRSVLTQR